MKWVTPDAKARGAYLILFLASLPIPILHYRKLGDALWAVRYPWGLHPIQNLWVWDLGRLSVVFPVAILVILTASFMWRRLCAPSVLVGVAFGASVFTALYGYFCGLALWMALPK